MKNLLHRLLGIASRRSNQPPEIMRARQFIAAIDAGGIPLDPKIISRIAEDLGLDVSRNARTEDTIERIRSAVNRC